MQSPRVSGRHAELIFVGESLFIRDLDSTNGTFLNRQRVSQPAAIESGDHIEIADVEFRVQYQAPVSEVPIEEMVKELNKTVHDFHALAQDWVLSQFDQLLLERSVIPHFQSIVELDHSNIVGYEALARSSMTGLENPGRLFQTAEMVNQEVELSILCRERACELAQQIGLRGPLFVNTHPHENIREDVIPSLESIQQHYPQLEIVIELHEKSVQNAEEMLDHKAKLNDLGVRIAYDDFGAGQSRFLELLKAPPDYLKFDRSLIQDIHEAPLSQTRMLSSFIQTARELDIVTLAEGIENEYEAQTCRDLGFDLAQGFYYSLPCANPQPQG